MFLFIAYAVFAFLTVGTCTLCLTIKVEPCMRIMPPPGRFETAQLSVAVGVVFNFYQMQRSLSLEAALVFLVSTRLDQYCVHASV
jgi:hypothetical protein